MSLFSESSADLTLSMAAVSSPLGLCSFCRDATARAYLAKVVHAWQVREDFLHAQDECYICTWIRPRIKLHVLDTMPQRFKISFRCIHRRETELRVEMNEPGVGNFIVVFSTNSNAEFTRSFPAAVADFHNSQLRTLAAHWIEECRRNHQECIPTESDFRPKRLVQIIDKSHWKLVFPRHLPREDRIDYVALSHCWGGSTQLLKLVEDNVYQLQSRMAVATLPTTFKEAFSACLELNFQYLWIDSLCIIQDSPADWQEQAAEMNLVYGNAVLSLCMAASSTASEASFQSRNTDLMLPLSLTVTGRDGKERALHMICQDMFYFDIWNSPLLERGWVFQEWYLAKRSLIFGRMQLWWQCCEDFACESIPGGTSDTDVFRFFTPDFEAKKGRNLKRLKDPLLFDQHWWALVPQYANTKLTEETKDRVMAFSGIARVLGESHSIEDQYVAGMWRCYLPQSLLWLRFNQGESHRSSKGYKAPSWSWMSVDGPSHLINIIGGSRTKENMEEQNVKNRCCCSIEQVCLSLVDKCNITGRLRGGFIHIRGHLLGLCNKDVDENDIEYKSSLSDFGQDFKATKVMKWDETDDKGAAFVSYLGNITVEACQKGHSTVFSRIRLPLEHAEGSFFALPVLHQTDDSEDYTERTIAGLVLYQPPQQPDIFHRVALYYESDRPGLVGKYDQLDFASFTERLSQYPARSIYIF